MLAKVKMEKRELMGINQSGFGQFTVFVLESRMDITFLLVVWLDFALIPPKVIEEL